MKFDPAKLRLAAAFGFLAVSLGALGAHGLETSWKTQFDADKVLKLVDTWKTASLYHIVHSVVLLLLAYAFPTAADGKWIFRSFASGIVIFSGSLYLYCVTGKSWLGAITPIGGLLMILGWLFLAVRAGARGASK